MFLLPREKPLHKFNFFYIIYCAFYIIPTKSLYLMCNIFVVLDNVLFPLECAMFPE